MRVLVCHATHKFHRERGVAAGVKLVLRVCGFDRSVAWRMAQDLKQIFASLVDSPAKLLVETRAQLHSETQHRATSVVIDVQKWRGRFRPVHL